MTVKHVIQGKGAFVATIRPDATLSELVETLAEHRIGAMVVSSDGTHIEGIVSERDIVRALRVPGHVMELDAVLVRQIMTADVTTCSPATSIDEVMAVMTESRIRHVPVVLEEALVGIVSIGDIVKARISHLELERSALVDYVTMGR